MTPEEIDQIMDAMEPVCCVCADACVPLTGGSCQSCFNREFGHPGPPVRQLFMSGSIANTLSLLKGSKSVPATAMHSERERMTELRKIFRNVDALPEERQALLYTRFCALYLRHLADVLVGAPRNSRYEPFESFALILGRIYKDRYFIKLCLSEDPRARSGNDLANALAYQIIVYASKWSRGWWNEASEDFRIVAGACFTLNYVLLLHNEKADAIPLQENYRQQLADIVSAWVDAFGDNNTSIKLMEEVLLLHHVLEKGPGWEKYVQLHWSRRPIAFRYCDRPGCKVTEDLLLCSRCRSTVYCSRQHQAEDWRGTPVLHKQICYQSFF